MLLLVEEEEEDRGSQVTVEDEAGMDGLWSWARVGLKELPVGVELSLQVFFVLLLLPLLTFPPLLLGHR